MWLILNWINFLVSRFTVHLEITSINNSVRLCVQQLFILNLCEVAGLKCALVIYGAVVNGRLCNGAINSFLPVS
jgi:hypothetical protein